MIVPITISKGGQDKNIGTARVVPLGDDFYVEFYLIEHYVISEEAKHNIAEELKKLARSREKS